MGSNAEGTIGKAKQRAAITVQALKNGRGYLEVGGSKGKG